MCGIFGVVSLAGEPLKHPLCLQAMAASLAHRGPDGERIIGHERARIGARRLAIMDLTTGDQPFQSPDGAIWMVCNGEIYNSPALRLEARGWGYPFRSTGDIENIVPFYERLGPDAVARLDGMFGLAVWDDRRRRLVLARDRAGEKPLFWTRVSGEVRLPPRSRRCWSSPTNRAVSTGSPPRSTRASATSPRRTRCSKESISSRRRTCSSPRPGRSRSDPTGRHGKPRARRRGSPMQCSCGRRSSPPCNAS